MTKVIRDFTAAVDWFPVDDRDELEARLIEPDVLEELAIHLFGEPNNRHGNWRWGSQGRAQPHRLRHAARVVQRLGVRLSRRSAGDGRLLARERMKRKPSRGRKTTSAAARSRRPTPKRSGGARRHGARRSARPV